jgi:hypothetical protein
MRLLGMITVMHNRISVLGQQQLQRVILIRCGIAIAHNVCEAHP